MYSAFVILSLAACFIDGATVKATSEGKPELELFRGAEARCEGDELVVSSPGWPAPWRLVREVGGTWREASEPALPRTGPVVDRFRVVHGWIAREEALAAWMRSNRAVTHGSLLSRLQAALEELKREAAPRLSPYTRLGTMPAAQPLEDAWWSADGFCVAQWGSGKVRCFTPGRGWGKPVPRRQRPAIAGDTAFTNSGETVSLGPINWQLSELGGAPWRDSSDARDCAANIPSREAVDAVECADPNSTRCAAWARYAPTDWPSSCEVSLERLLWAPGGGALVIIVRTSHERDRAGSLGLWLATVLEAAPPR